MRPIPPKLRAEIDKNKDLKKCWICGSSLVEINHTFIYSGKQINELWALSSLCKEHHTGNTGFHNCQETKEKIEKMCLDKVDLVYLMANYPRRNWQQLKKYLCQKLKYQ